MIPFFTNIGKDVDLFAFLFSAYFNIFNYLFDLKMIDSIVNACFLLIFLIFNVPDLLKKFHCFS